MTQPTYTPKKLQELIEDDTLVSLYHNSIMREKSAEVAQTYKYFFNKDISQSKLVKPVFALTDNLNSPAHSIFTEVAYNITTSLGLDYFTNADLKNKKIHKTLIHTILCDNSAAEGKIQALSELRDNAVFLTFLNVDKATPAVSALINDFIRNQPDNFFIGLEAAQDNPYIENVERVRVEAPQLSLQAKTKMK